MKNDQPIEKPNLEDVPMHMPEGELAIDTTEKSSSILNGPTLLILIFILVLILGGLVWWYFLLTNQPLPTIGLRPTAEQNNEPESTTAEARTATMEAVSTSDELNAIAADLTGTTIPPLEADFAAIESVLEDSAE